MVHVFCIFGIICPKVLDLYAIIYCRYFVYLKSGFPNPSLYQRTKLTLSPGREGVMLHGRFVSIPATDWTEVSGTGRKKRKLVYMSQAISGIRHFRKCLAISEQTTKKITGPELFVIFEFDRIKLLCFDCLLLCFIVFLFLFHFK